MFIDEVAEWLRRWTANPLGSARVGSNPTFVVIFLPKLCNLLMVDFVGSNLNEATFFY